MQGNASTDREAILSALAHVSDPLSGRDIVEAGLVKGLAIEGDTVRFAIEIDPARAAEMEPVRQAAQAAAGAVPGVGKVLAVLTAHSAAPSAKQAPAAPPPNLGAPRRAGPGDKPLRPVPPPPNGGQIPGVERVIAVASGKGGVGKSTVSVNLAVALAREGARVGLLDADVYGPSQPRMLGITGQPTTSDGKTIEPMRGHGVVAMSMGFLTGEDQSVVWRGPMLMSALTQMLHQVNWGTLDYLVVDLPPGTGDVQLTLAQKANVTGAIVVSTPQDIALIDARKAIDMFAKTKTPVLGLVENMSTFCCPACGHESAIFGEGGVEREAAARGLDLLARIPLDLDTRILSDEGKPVVASRPTSPQAARFTALARSVMERVTETSR
jgi:ATP-binding protein involved in chromosome partitioning